MNYPTWQRKAITHLNHSQFLPLDGRDRGSGDSYGGFSPLPPVISEMFSKSYQKGPSLSFLACLAPLNAQHPQSVIGPAVHVRRDRKALLLHKFELINTKFTAVRSEMSLFVFSLSNISISFTFVLFYLSRHKSSFCDRKCSLTTCWFFSFVIILHKICRHV